MRWVFRTDTPNKGKSEAKKIRWDELCVFVEVEQFQLKWSEQRVYQTSTVNKGEIQADARSPTFYQCPYCTEKAKQSKKNVSVSGNSLCGMPLSDLFVSSVGGKRKLTKNNLHFNFLYLQHIFLSHFSIGTRKKP